MNASTLSLTNSNSSSRNCFADYVSGLLKILIPVRLYRRQRAYLAYLLVGFGFGVEFHDDFGYLVDEFVVDFVFFEKFSHDSFLRHALHFESVLDGFAFALNFDSFSFLVDGHNFEVHVAA